MRKNGQQKFKNAVTFRGDEGEKNIIPPTTPKGD